MTTQPQIVKFELPKYSQLAANNNIQGTTLVKITVNEHGQITHFGMQKSSGSSLLDAAALESIPSWKLKPALDQNGKPVAAEMVVPFVFRITRSLNTIQVAPVRR